jgi:hypothetical protein
MPPRRDRSATRGDYGPFNLFTIAAFALHHDPAGPDLSCCVPCRAPM